MHVCLLFCSAGSADHASADAMLVRQVTTAGTINGASHSLCKRRQSMVWTKGTQSVALTRCTMGEMLEYSKNF